jgi:N-acetylglucosaminyl-diphospho-decaprenol L-rhamnosyltransferase
MVAKKPYFTVIIVAHNSGEYLGECIESLSKQNFTDFEVLVVDNGSSDGAIEVLNSYNLKLKIIKLLENTGFAAGNNLAAREANGDWLILLNADAIPQLDWMFQIKVAINRYTEIVIFGSTQLRYNDTKTLDGAGDHYHPSGLAWRGGEGHSVDTVSGDMAVLGPCAAAAVYRRDIYDKLGGMEESFFCYYEDVDLALRYRLSGHLCIQLALAKVKHVGSATFGAQSDFIRYHVSRNRIWTFIRCVPGPLLIPLFPGFLMTIALRLLISLFTRDFGVRFKALCDAVTKLPEIWCQRRLIQKSRKISFIQFSSAMTWSIGKLLMRASDGKSISDHRSCRKAGKNDV